jgi:hypothetical protein
MLRCVSRRERPRGAKARRFTVLKINESHAGDRKYFAAIEAAERTAAVTRVDYPGTFGRRTLIMISVIGSSAEMPPLSDSPRCALEGKIIMVTLPPSKYRSELPLPLCQCPKRHLKARFRSLIGL